VSWYFLPNRVNTRWTETKNPTRLAHRWVGLADEVLIHQIKAVGIHHLGPCGHKVVHEFFAIVVLGIHLGIGAKNGVGAKHQIHPACCPLGRTSGAIDQGIAVLASCSFLTVLPVSFMEFASNSRHRLTQYAHIPIGADLTGFSNLAHGCCSWLSRALAS